MQQVANDGHVITTDYDRVGQPTETRQAYSSGSTIYTRAGPNGYAEGGPTHCWPRAVAPSA